MAIAWFIVPYERGPSQLATVAVRRCAMVNFSSQVNADGGRWREVEVLGNRAIVKVNASAATLSIIAATFQRIPLALLDDPLSSLTGAQLLAIRNALTDAGYTLAEVTARFPNIADYTLGDVLRYMASRRRKPRYDVQTDTIILDGENENCESVDLLNQAIT